MAPYVVRIMQPSDVTPVVFVHLQSFPGFFLTFLGEDFLRVLYDRTLALPEAMGFVALDDSGTMNGFVIGVTSQRSLYCRLLEEHWAAFALASLRPILRRPSIMLRLIRALRRPEEAQQSAADCLLMSIAVRPELQGQHIGGQLVAAFLTEAQQRGVRAVSLTTDRDGNAPVNLFYQKLGFKLARSFATAEGRWMNEYVVDL